MVRTGVPASTAPRRPYDGHVLFVAAVSCLIAVAYWLTSSSGAAAAAGQKRLRIDWQRRILTITGDQLPAPVEVLYIEAYCRPGSTHRRWGETVIKHESKRVDDGDDPHRVEIVDTLADGVIARHTITAGTDEVDFRITLTNPTDRPSEVWWAQPCVRVDRFTGTTRDDRLALYPAYIRRSFLFIDGKLARMPTRPWATKALYTPGQVYRLNHVNPDNVNPRPLSPLIASNPIVGCFSADGSKLMAIAFVPCQEIFQGVIACLHSDFRVAGLAPGQTKQVRGKIYFLDADIDRLLDRFRRDFPRYGRAR